MSNATEQQREPITYLYFGNDWDPENRTSSHHVARWMAERSQLMYFECPGLRAPKTNSRDIGRLFRKLRIAFAAPRRPSPTVEVRTLLQLPFHRVPGMRKVNQWLLRFAVGRVVRQVRHRPGKLVSWFVSPHVGSLARRIGEDLAVQYCVDDYASFPGVDAGAVTAMDNDLTHRADLVFVASATLLERKRPMTEHLVLSPHGVDVAHFRQATELSAPLPDDIRDLTGPVIGFFGLIEAWIDLPLIAELADRHPEWTFLMIGRVVVPEEQTPRRPNIRYIGPRPYGQLPEYGRRFDVSVIPYLFTQQVHFANPIKLREYLAMEKPIVAVPTPEIDKFADVVRIARGADAWDAAITEALATARDPDRIAAMRAAADAMTWDARLHRVESIVRDALDGRPFDPPPVSR